LIYRAFFNLIFSRLNPETAHHLGVVLIKFLGATGLADLARLGSKPGDVKVMGLEFKGPFGMAAGFDKNAEMIKELGQLGFSHVEIGTVTRHAQGGNPKPRLFRLKKDLSLINRMGFNNEGADAVSKRLEKFRSSGSSLPIIGVNIGKSKITELEDAVSDYEYSAGKLAPFADYIAVNVSSPNTPGLRSLQAIDQLEPILKAIIDKAAGKPVLVKIAPDLADEDVVAVAALATKLRLAGVIATNTTVSRAGLRTDSKNVSAMGAGGLSGPILKERSLEVLKLLRANLPSEIVIVSVGGVFSPTDVSQRLELGASLVQGYTGFVYEGPLWARKINRGLK
jgi:dihydroorotate dehydrogenase